MRNTLQSRRATKALFLTSIFAAFSVVISTAQTTFIGATGGSWFTATNWSNGLPAAGNNALIPGGGVNVVIGSALNVNFTIDNFSSMTATAAITIASGGNFSNSGNLNLNAGSSLTNAATFNNFGTAVFVATASFTNQSAGNFTNAGTFTLPGTLTNAGSVTNNGTLNAANGLVQTSGSFSNNQTMSSKSLTISTASQFLNNFGANLNISGTGATLDLNGNLTNNGTVNLAGAGNIIGAGVLDNNVQFNVQSGGSLIVAATARINNNGTLLNQASFTNNGTVINGNNFYNENVAINKGTFAQNNRLENRLGATFTNEVASTITMGFGSILLNIGTFINKADINSFGTITNDGTFSNAFNLTNNSGGTIDNNKTFNNTGTLNSFNAFINDDVVNNDFKINIGSGSILTNNKTFNNNPLGSINNEFEIYNKPGATFTNKGKVINLVRFFVDAGTLANQAYFENPGDVFVATGATLNNSGLFSQLSGNTKNAGTITNSSNFLSDDCASIVNIGAISNSGLFQFRGIFFQRGTMTGTAASSLGGYTHTAATSSAPTVCANRTISADVNGVVKAYATSLVAFANFDSCQNIIYRANGIARPSFGCADIGTIKNMNLVVRTRLGDSLTCVSQVTPADLLGPTIANCPTDVFVSTPNNTANVTWIAPTATDNCTASPTISTTAAPGSSFPIGITAVNYTATDARNNTAICQFKINVVKTGGTSNCAGDVTAPTIQNCPANLAVATFGNNAAVNWQIPTVADACAPTSISGNFLPGTTFGLGKTNVVYTARDGNNNTSTCTFQINVFKNETCLTDTQKPVYLTCPTNIFLPLNANLNGALATWTAPAVSDNCAVNTQTQTHSSGSVFPSGSTSVIYTATDNSNNSASCNFTVFVGADPCPGDVAGPTFSNCPISQTITIPVGSTSPATWTAPTISDACTPTTLVSNFVSGASFGIGTTQVKYTASDRKGNSSVCTFNIIVQTPCGIDATPPVISGCPANVTVGTTAATAAATWVAPVASDPCGLASFNSSYASGAIFPVGTTQVVYTAADFKGNTSSCAFNVIVTNAPGCATNASPINNATAQPTATLNLTWNTVANATAYDVFLDLVNPPTKLVAPNVTATSLVLNTLNGGTDYFWYVVPKNAAGSATACTPNITKFSTSGTPQGGSTYTINNALGICKGTTGLGLTRQTWTGITGSLVSNLTSNAAYPNSPNTTEIFAAAKSVWNSGDNYGTRVRGFITPTVSGNYVFTITGDDETQLFFAQNENPNNKFLVANIPTWTNELEFTKMASQKSTALFMAAGQNYYIELLQKEGTGGDGWGIFWTAPSTTTTVQIPLANLSPITNDCPVSTTSTGAASRVSSGLVVLYDFKEGSGNVVNDVSGNGTPLNLTINTPANVSRLAGSCGLRINTATIIKPATGVSSSKISTALAATNAVTIEAWVKPTNTTQTGPARIVTYSSDLTNRNFTLAQTSNTYVQRLRTTAGDANGSPEISSGAVATTNLQHVVYLRNAAGYEAIYVDGELTFEGTRTGTFNFNSTYNFALGNELTNNAPWLGEYDLVAVYNRALSPSEIAQNYHVGVCATVNNNVCNQNLIGNGSFEKDLFAWSATNGAAITTTAGNFSAGTRGVQACNLNGQISEAARATAGSTLTLNVKARRSTTGATGTVNMNFTDVNGTQLGSVISQSITATTFTTHTLTGVAPANTYWVNLWVTHTNSTGCIYTDEFCLTDGTKCAAKLRVINSAACTVKLYSFNGSTETFSADILAGATGNFPSFDTQIWRLRRSSDGSLIRELTIAGCNDQTISITNCGGTTGSSGGGCTGDVTVPTIAGCPANISQTTTGTTATATWTAPTASDNCGNPLFTSNFQPGATFPLGTTTVRYTAFDTKTNTATCQFTVSINNTCANDVTAPTFSGCPTNISQSTANITTIVNWTAPTAADNCSTPNVSATHTPGQNFAPGTTIVKYTAVDARGNTAVCQFNVVITSTNPCSNDLVAPTILGCPTNINQPISSGTGATVSWTSPIPNDNCGIPNFETNHIPGEFFLVGNTTVLYKATDIGGNTAICQFIITVVVNPCAFDAVPPVIAGCPANQTKSVAGTTSTATWTAPTATDNCPGTVNLTSNFAPGATFPLGVTSVIYTATDVKLNAATCNFTITVNQIDPCLTETTPPVIANCPANQSIQTAGTSATATWTAPTATDNCPGTVNLTSNFAPGATFPLGLTTVIYTARDVRLNASTCNFTINITQTNPCLTETTPPVIANCPANQTITTAGNSATATWTAPTATDNCPGTVNLTSNFAPGATFPLGLTTVIYTATDVRLNTATCNFSINVSQTNPCLTETTPPVIANCPANQTITTAGNSATATWTAPTATDNCPGTVNLVSNFAPGATFPLGLTTVIYTATDVRLNTATCSFTINVSQNSNPLDCNNIQITTSGSSILCSGLTAPVVLVQVFDATFSPIYNCTGNCNKPVQAINNLAAGTYFVKVDFLDASWSPLCKKEQFISVSGGGGTGVLTFNAPADITVTAPVNQNFVQVNFSMPAATSTCTVGAVAVNQTSGLVSGALFPVGTSQVCFVASDGCNNTKTACFNIVVQSGGGGTGNCNNIVFTPTGGTITVTNLVSPITMLQVFDPQFNQVYNCAGNCASPTVVVEGLTSGVYFVKATLLDATWNAICAKEQYVPVGAGGPVLTFNAPANITVTAAPNATSAAVTYSVPTASTTCTVGNISINQTSGLPSGAQFPVGTTQICFEATDGCNNVKTACFNVVVNANSGGGGTDCNAITITPGAGNIVCGNLTAPIVLIQVFDAAFSPVASCVGNCSKPTHTFSGLAAGQYFVKVDFLDASWAAICKKEQFVTVAAGRPAGSELREGEEVKPLIFNNLDEISVFPNPTSDRFFVNLLPLENENVNLKLIGFDGRVLKNWEAAASSELFEIETSEMQTGVYFLKIETAERRATILKVVVAK